MKKLNVGVIGCGRIGITHIESIRALGNIANLHCVIDMNKQLSESIGEKYGVLAYASVEEALNDKLLDAVIVGLPHFLHKPVTIAALEKGKHVLCEKPISLDYQETLEMYDAADKNHCVLMSGQSRRFFNELIKAKEIVKDHALGEPRSMIYNFTCFFDEGTAPKWWKDEAKVGGLALPMLASHSLDYCLWVLEDLELESLYCAASKRHAYFEGEDEAVIVLKFKDGTTATNYLSVNNRPAHHKCQIICEHGNIYFSHTGDHSGLIGTADTQLFINGRLEEFPQNLPNNFTLQAKEFFEAILENRNPSVSPDQIKLLMQLIDVAKESSKQNRVIQING